MSDPRFFVAGESEGAPGDVVELVLGAADRHHALDVLRLGVGDRLIVIGPDGAARTVELVTCGPDTLTACIIAIEPPPAEPDVTLVQGLGKGAKMDLVVEKAVELGVRAIVPVVFERSVARPDAERGARRTERWRRVALAAAKQSGRTFVPGVSEPQGFFGFLPSLADYDRCVVLWEDEPDTTFTSAMEGLGATARVAVVVGPEGGLIAEEVAALRERGCVTASLGATVLRTETAGIVAAALCLYELGGLGGRSRG